MKDRIAKLIIYFLGLISLAAFVIIRIRGGEDYVASKNMGRYGDLGLTTMVDNFLVDLPPYLSMHLENPLMPYRLSGKHPEFVDANFYTLGDSYFYFPRQVTFPERLADTTNLKVYFDNIYNPYQTFEKFSYQNEEKRYLLYEIVEYHISVFFLNRITPEQFPKYEHKVSPLIQTVSGQEAEKRYVHLVQRSWLTRKLVQLVSTLRYNWFGYISMYTPLYKDNPPWLFYYDTVNDKYTSSFYN